MYEMPEVLEGKNLQRAYNQWRSAYEKTLKAQGGDFYSCFAEARERFSQYIRLGEIISYDSMWELEMKYSR